jgi:hypothetical protein
VSRRPFDAYYTPAWPVRRFLERYTLPTPGRWLEPGAGEGNIIRAVDEHYRRRDLSSPLWTAVEIRPECRLGLWGAAPDALITADFLGANVGSGFDVTFGNPPYDRALDFWRRARELAAWVVFLLRIDFMATAKRGALFRLDQPDICVVPDRISFTDDGRTDQYDYAWFAWPPAKRSEGRIITLDATPLAERKRGRLDLLSA